MLETRHLRGDRQLQVRRRLARQTVRSQDIRRQTCETMADVRYTYVRRKQLVKRTRAHDQMAPTPRAFYVYVQAHLQW